MNRPSNEWVLDGRAFKLAFSPPSAFGCRGVDDEEDFEDEVEDDVEGEVEGEVEYSDESGRSDSVRLRLGDCDG
jgi:hypothetical protein